MSKEAQSSNRRVGGEGPCLVWWCGDIDIASGPGASRRCTNLPPRCKVELDLTGVTFMDASGLRSLRNVVRTFSDTGRRLRIVGRSASVERVIDLAGLSNNLGLASPAA